MKNILINNVSKIYKQHDETKTVLSEINFTIPKGELFCIMGSSGSGKSTLLKIIGAMEKPTSGDIIIEDRKMSAFTPTDIDQYRQNTIGYVFQDFNLLGGLTLKENIILPLTLQKLDHDEIERRYQKIMQYVDIAYCQDNYPEKSSGGEQQRAAICRALIKFPQLLLADEPTGNLDNSNVKTVLESLSNINRKLETTIIIVTHDAVVASYCNTVAFIEEGTVHRILNRSGTMQSFYDLIVTESSKVRGIL